MTDARGILAEYLVNDFQSLGEQGYQVIKNVVTDTDKIIYDLNNELRTLEQNYIADDLTLLQQYGIGDTESCWNSRIATLQLWENLFKTKHLLSSWDGISVVRPEEQMKSSKLLNMYNEPDWIHRDQRLSNENLADSIQGFLSLSSGNNYSTIIYKPKSGTAQQMIDAYHQHFHRKFNRFGRKIDPIFSDEDYYEFSEDELVWLRKYCTLEKPELDCGDMLLWMSAMPHAACSDVNCSEHVNTRLGTFISMIPKKLVNCSVLSERRKLAKMGLTSSHNVMYTKLFPFSKYQETMKHKNSYSTYIYEQRKKLIG